MDPASPSWKTIMSRGPFRLAWVALALGVAAIILGAIFLPLVPLLVGAALMVAALAVMFAAIYSAAKLEWAGALERNELSGLLGAVEDALILYDQDFKVVFFNEAAEKLFNLKSAAVLGRRLSPRDVEQENWRTLVQVVFPSLAPQVVAQSPEGRYPTVAEVTFAEPELALRVTTAPIVDEGGKTLAFLKLVRDLTPQKTAMRAKDEFIAVASHQLRGPVTDINWALEALADATELNETDKMIVQNATAACQGLLRRIEDFLDLSRIEGGRLEYTFEPADIAEFLQKSLAEVTPAARTAGIKLYFDRPNVTLPGVSIDPKQLLIVVVNLIENAIRYNIENGEVIVKVEAVSGKPFVEVSVRDTGIGIPAEAIPKLFTKFYRAENAVKSQTEGSGIGLYVARGIVRAHGGDIWVESELGRGTTVHFTLPTDPNLIPKHTTAE
jgi:PAS domain S-box-containing protein